MKEALKGLLGSKKALAALAGSITSAGVLLAAKHGYGLDPAAAETLVKAVLGLVGLYIVGQGAADWGKEKAKVEIAAAEAAESLYRLGNADFDDDDDDDEPKVLTEDA